MLSVGRLVKVKNQKHMIDVISKLPSNYELIFVGDGDEKQSLMKYCLEKGLENRVYFCGETENVDKYYQKCDYLLLTSHRETYPNVALEATANAIPIITYDIPGGIREIVENNKNGFIVPWGDVNGMVKVIENYPSFDYTIPEKLLTKDDYFKKCTD